VSFICIRYKYFELFTSFFDVMFKAESTVDKTEMVSKRSKHKDQSSKNKIN